MVEKQESERVGRIRDLPRWAQVAMAARAARRVAVLHEWGWPAASQAARQAVAAAVEAAEQVAAHTRAVEPGDMRRLAGDAEAAARAAMDADPDEAITDADRGVTGHSLSAAHDAAMAAALAAEAAADAIEHAPDRVQAAERAVDTALRAVGQATAAIAGNEQQSEDSLQTAVEGEIEADLTRLTAAMDKQAGRGSDEDAVPTRVFGDLWPHGEPRGWPSGS